MFVAFHHICFFFFYGLLVPSLARLMMGDCGFNLGRVTLKTSKQVVTASMAGGEIGDRCDDWLESD